MVEYFVGVALVAGGALLVGPWPAHAFTFDLRETVQNTATGTPCEICAILTLPAPQGVEGGYVILFEPGSTGDINNRATWTDVVIFGSKNNGVFMAQQGQVNQVRFLSAGCNSTNESTNEGDVS